MAATRKVGEAQPDYSYVAQDKIWWVNLPFLTTQSHLPVEDHPSVFSSMHLQRLIKDSDNFSL